ncbi:hypothetical protein [Streptomyces cellulosae]|uniref:hypothetical protein n=1 Tax=Streptomyces cellulosae TaxID=1968 RepID=UPI00131A6B2B|nr:hypothetical protein [Streptomyces cellulosae]
MDDDKPVAIDAVADRARGRHGHQVICLAALDISSCSSRGDRCAGAGDELLRVGQEGPEVCLVAALDPDGEQLASASVPDVGQVQPQHCRGFSAYAEASVAGATLATGRPHGRVAD